MRMRHHPEGADLLYEALDNDDLELAHKIAVKYNFAIREEAIGQTKYVYFARYYDGDIKRYETIRELSKALGGSFDAVRLRLARHSGTYWTKGKMKGYVIWQEKAGLSDEPLRTPTPLEPPVVTKRKDYTYFLKWADGKVSEYESINALAEVLGRDTGNLYQYFNDNGGYTWRQGELKGMSVWRVEC